MVSGSGLVVLFTNNLITSARSFNGIYFSGLVVSERNSKLIARSFLFAC